MKSLKKCNQRGCLRRTQVLPISGHVTATLNHLTDQLILRKAYSDTVKRWASLATGIPERMAITTLLHLKYQRALSFQRGRPV